MSMTSHEFRRFPRFGAGITIDAVAGIEPPHPRAIEMAEAMREGATQFKQLIHAGYTSAEITEFRDVAQLLATERSTRQVGDRPDLLADIVDKARAPIANQPPLPRDTAETQALLVAWNAYCVAHASLRLDPWEGQRARCLDLLGRALRHVAIFERNRASVIEAVRASLMRVQ